MPTLHFEKATELVCCHLQPWELLILFLTSVAYAVRMDRAWIVSLRLIWRIASLLLCG